MAILGWWVFGQDRPRQIKQLFLQSFAGEYLYLGRCFHKNVLWIRVWLDFSMYCTYCIINSWEGRPCSRLHLTTLCWPGDLLTVLQTVSAFTPTYSPHHLSSSPTLLHILTPYLLTDTGSPDCRAKPPVFTQHLNAQVLVVVCSYALGCWFGK